jgi:hypothetical protein
VGESQLSEIRNMRVLLEEARLLSRDLAYHRRARLEAVIGWALEEVELSRGDYVALPWGRNGGARRDGLPRLGEGRHLRRGAVVEMFADGPSMGDPYPLWAPFSAPKCSPQGSPSSSRSVGLPQCSLAPRGSVI